MPSVVRRRCALPHCVGKTQGRVLPFSGESPLFLKNYNFFLKNTIPKRINYVYICSENNQKPSYQPGLERWSMYKTLWTRHWTDF